MRQCLHICTRTGLPPCHICTATRPAGGEAVRRDGRRAARLRPRRDPARVLQELLGEPLCELISARTTAARRRRRSYRIDCASRNAGTTDTARPAVLRMHGHNRTPVTLAAEGFKRNRRGASDRARRGEARRGACHCKRRFGEWPSTDATTSSSSTRRSSLRTRQCRRRPTPLALTQSALCALACECVRVHACLCTTPHG